MANKFICSSRMSLSAAAASKPPVLHSPFNLNNARKYGNQQQEQQQREKKKSPILFKPYAAKSGGGFSLDSILKRCQTCGGQGAVDCPGCKGTGKNKKNGNMFERWKCYDCQGFGLKSCPSCGKGRGLTPEQRGER